MGKKVYITLAIIFLIILVAIGGFILWYNIELKAPLEVAGEKVIIDIENGVGSTSIFELLQEKDVIRSGFVAKIYTKLHEISVLKAGKYEFTRTETLPEVLDIISSGKVMDETIKITFLEGKNMRYIASTIAEKTNNSINDVYAVLENKAYISTLIEKYWFLTNEIQDANIYYPLEGYLYPDTYVFENVNVKVETIFEKMLNQMGSVLTKYRSQIQNQSHSVHEILTMASIIELEGTNAENRLKVASVMYNRLAQNMSLGSDVTTYYAIRVDMGERDLYEKEINTYNAYNTRGPNMNGKLPIGPIAGVSEQSINAALNPYDESYLYFVSDKNGDMYFTKTYEEHQQMIDTKYK